MPKKDKSARKFEDDWDDDKKYDRLQKANRKALREKYKSQRKKKKDFWDNY